MNVTPETTPWISALRGNREGSSETMKNTTPVITPARETGREKTLGMGFGSRSELSKRDLVTAEDTNPPGEDVPGYSARSCAAIA